MYLKCGKKLMVMMLLSLFAVRGNAADLNSLITQTHSGGAYSRSTKLWHYQSTIKNNSPATLTDLVLTFKGAEIAGMFLQGGEYNQAGEPFLRLLPDGGLLKPGQTITVPHVWIPSLSNRHGAFKSNVLTGSVLTAENSALVSVSVFNFSDDPDHPKGSSAGAGAKIYGGGVLRATTDAYSGSRI